MSAHKADSPGTSSLVTVSGTKNGAELDPITAVARRNSSLPLSSARTLWSRMPMSLTSVPTFFFTDVARSDSPSANLVTRSGRRRGAAEGARSRSGASSARPNAPPGLAAGRTTGTNDEAGTTRPSRSAASML